ncbi:dipeptidase 1-like [Penaeus vannamei]|uniref:dipeptidase 1-like n=1 Tax=Penaeus vannamei TaxID=6689 RepID=UPI00387F6013
MPEIHEVQLHDTIADISLCPEFETSFNATGMSPESLAGECCISVFSTGVEVPAHVWGGVCLVLVLAGVAGVGVSVPLALRVDHNAKLQERLSSATTLLRESPLIDGHNDLPWNIRKFMHNKLHSFNFTAELKKLRPWSRSSWSHTDLPRLRRGMVGAQFWVSYVPCESQKLNAVQLTIEQIDLIKRLVDQYPDDLRLATSADEVEAAFTEGRIASLIGVEGGHAIQNSLGVLRALRDLGVRYLTLTHTCSTPWAESARARETDLEDPDSPRGLTQFGKYKTKLRTKGNFSQNPSL